jgi:hypothetical protein
MPWVISLGLLLLLMQCYQWLHGLHFSLPIALVAAIGLALLSNSGWTWPKLPRIIGKMPQPEVLLATLEPPRQLSAAETAKFALNMAQSPDTESGATQTHAQDQTGLGSASQSSSSKSSPSTPGTKEIREIKLPELS